MNIEFTKLGALKNGSLTTKPLTIFCGANNSGKTYAMYLLYGLASDLLTSTQFALPEVRNFVQSLLETGQCEVDLIELYKKNAAGIVSEIADELNKNLNKFFNSSNKNFDETEIALSIDDEMTSNLERIKALKVRRRVGINISDKSMAVRVAKDSGENVVTFSLVGEFDEVNAKRLEGIIKRQIFRLSFNSRYSRAFLLPAERAGINIFQRELVAKRTAYFHSSHVIPNDVDEDFEKNIARYPKPIADYIDFLNELEIYKAEESEFADLAELLEGGVLNGKYSIVDGDITFFPQEHAGSISLHLTSSTVKTYFGFWFYLRHIASAGDWLMIDEPELSLHPDNQRKVARVLTSLVNRGINVVISTHSDYIVREINNLIMLSSEFIGRDELLQKFGYANDQIISPEKIAAFTFYSSQMIPMEIDPEEGIISQSFDEVINSLNTSSNEIFYARRDSNPDPLQIGEDVDG